MPQRGGDFVQRVARRIAEVRMARGPAGGTDLASVLGHAFDDYFARKSAKKTKASGETILVVTDGEPDDKLAVMRTIVAATKRLERDEELAVSLVQVGRDPSATRFLKAATGW